MNNKHTIKQLGINGEVFAELRKHFDAVLQRTLRNMQSRGCDSADISIKLAITVDTVENFHADNEGVVHSEIVRKPLFAHKVSASMKIKDTEQGFFNENYDLVYEPNIGEFILVPIIDRQMQLLSEDNEDE